MIAAASQPLKPPSGVSKTKKHAGVVGTAITPEIPTVKTKLINNCH